MTNEGGDSRDRDGQGRANLISAIAHPLRRRILRLLRGGGKPLGPIEIANEFGLPVGTVTYHTRVLWQLGAVEPAGEQQERGEVQRFYGSTIRDDPPIETLLEETRGFDEEEA